MYTNMIFSVMKVVLMLWALAFSFSTCNVSAAGVLSDQEIERQLKILNKPWIKTFQVIDCVDIDKQPALHNPLLKNNKIQWVDLAMEPKYRMFAVGADIQIQNLTLAQDQSGTASILIFDGITPNRNVIAAGWKVSPALYGDNRTRLYTYWRAIYMNETIECYNTLCPGFVQVDRQVTPSNLFFRASTSGGIPLDVRIQIFQAVHTNETVECFNTRCPGFVQVDRQVTPSTLVGPASTYGGPLFDVKVQVFQDRKSGNWWLSHWEKNILVGYWPKELLPQMGDGAVGMAWGGVATSGKDGMSPPTGNGHFPNGDDYDHSSYFADVHYVDHENKMVIPTSDADTRGNVDKSSCYEFNNVQLKNQNGWGYSFTFGGTWGILLRNFLLKN